MQGKKVLVIGIIIILLLMSGIFFYLYTTTVLLKEGPIPNNDPEFICYDAIQTENNDSFFSINESLLIIEQIKGRNIYLSNIEIFVLRNVSGKQEPFNNAIYLNLTHIENPFVNGNYTLSKIGSKLFFNILHIEDNNKLKHGEYINVFFYKNQYLLFHQSAVWVI